MKRLSALLSLEPAAVGSVAAAVYAAVAMLWRAYDHQGVLQPDLLVAAGMALWGLWTRSQVTPLSAPKDAAGRPLKPAQQ